MTQAWFVSDIHIADMNDSKAKIFLAFLLSLKRERQCSHLFLVGDIFDLWVGDHEFFTQKFSCIIDEIQRLRKDGVLIHYFEGNHDLHLSRYWRDTLGVEVHQGPQYFQLSGKTLRVEHGDESDPEDKGYLFLRWFLRTPLMRFICYNLPGKVVSQIGESASRRSRDYTSHTKTINDQQARERLHAHAERAYLKQPFDILINGHVHIRDDYQSSSFRAINLGTWLDEPLALCFCDGGIEMKTFESKC